MSASSTRPAGVTLVLWLFFFDALGFGALLFVFPGALVEIVAGDTGFNYFWVRWSGGWLVALAAGTLLLIRGRPGLHAFLTTLALGALAAGIGLLVAWLAGEYGGAAWFAALTLVATFPVAALLWWARGEMGRTTPRSK
jgi:hypothetical protein